jgi:prepilin-type N-terminal cleavage/methylation domain-containing protein
MTPPRTTSAGFTLLELVVSLTIMSILLGSMASAVILAGHAIPDGDDPIDRTALAVDAVDQIARDLVLADPITQAATHEVRFYVPDRGHGVSGAEKIIYHWSGTAGDPLLRSYNSAAYVAVCEGVHDFSLEYIREATPLLHTPRVLLVIRDDGTPTADESARQALIESWGFTVQLLGADASPGTFVTRYEDSDVMYVCETVSSTEMLAQDFNPGVGVVNEEQNLYDEYGLAQGTHAFLISDEIWVTNGSHPITAGIATGGVTIFDFAQEQVSVQGALAPGAQVITKSSGSHMTTVVLDAGAELYAGGRALRRRVGLAWGTNTFDFSLVNDTGARYMRQAIAWAAAPAAIGTVRITLQVGSDPGDRVETEVQLLNKPEEP